MCKTETTAFRVSRQKRGLSNMFNYSRTRKLN